MLDWYKKAHEYKEQLDEAQETIRQLRDILRPKAAFPPEWGLAPREARLLAAIAIRGEITKEAAGLATSLDAGSPPEEPELLAASVLCTMRPKLKPLGIKIGTNWGRGYYITDKSREIVKAALRVVDEVEN